MKLKEKGKVVEVKEETEAEVRVLTVDPPFKEDKPARKKYTQEELKSLTFPKKQKIAKKMGFNVLWLTEDEIDAILSGKTKTGGARYDRVEAMGLNREDVKEIERQKKQIPRDTYIPEEDYEDWMKIIAKKPMAFNGIDLTDKKAPVVNILEKHRNHVECECGAVFSIPEKDMNGNPVTAYPCPGVIKRIRLPKGGFREARVCMSEGKFRLFMIHKVPED